jgi:leucyl-tRNA synthetase
LPVNTYIGGAEHSVLHLLYARFISMALADLGLTTFEEPFTHFYAHGLIIKDGAKMSKSKGNVINPDLYLRKFGADSLRCYLFFLGPFNQGGDFRESGIEGMNRFLKRVWTMYASQKFNSTTITGSAKTVLHQTVKGVSEDLEALRYNTAIAKLMTYYNFLIKQTAVSHEEAKKFLQMLAPFAPFMTEELWEQIGNGYSIHTSQWPSFDQSAILENTLTVAIQVNGKLRGTVAIPSDEKEDKEKVEKLARENEGVKKFLQGTIRKVISVPGKVLNFVVDK